MMPPRGPTRHDGGVLVANRGHGYVVPMPTPPPLLTRAEVAERLQVTVRTLERWEDDGVLTPIRLGRNVRYRPEDVEAFIAKASA